MGSGCASVLKTHLSSGKTSSSENSRNRYFRVSARKKLSILSVLLGYGVFVCLSEANPPLWTLPCLWKACRISQPHSLYIGSLVTLYSTNRDSTVSGLSRFTGVCIIIIVGTKCQFYYDTVITIQIQFRVTGMLCVIY